MRFNKMTSVFLVFLLIFSLIAIPPPLQSTANAEVVEVEEQNISENVNREEATNEEAGKASSNAVDNQENSLENGETSSDSEVDEVVEETHEKFESHEGDDQEITQEPETEEVAEDDSIEEIVDEDEVDQGYEYDDFELNFEVVSKTKDSLTLTWSVSHNIVEEFHLYLNDKKVESFSSHKDTYTLKGLIPGKYYDIEIEAKLKDGSIYLYNLWEAPYWTKEDMVPVSIITMFNEDPSYYEQIRIRGIDESNKGFFSEEWIDYNDGDLFLPFGKFEVTVYDYTDPSIAAVETIEIKEGVDYLNHPIQLKFRLKEMREEAEPFHFEVTDVTENSFSLKWNDVSKILGYEIYGYDRVNGLHSIETRYIEKDTNTYTVGALDSNLIYSVNLIGKYFYDLEKMNYFNVKTYGEDAKAPKVKFAGDALRQYVASDLGVFFRDVTEADMKDLSSVSIYSNDLDSLEGLQYAYNLNDLHLYGNQVSNIDVLANLSKLEYLHLAHNKISDISALKNLNELYSLQLYGNEILDISALANLKELNYLDLANNKIADISTLKNLNKLDSLFISDNQLTDISAINNLLNLNRLGLGSNKITSIDSLANLTELNYLSLYNNKISDISALQNLKKMKDLDLGSNNISNIDAVANFSDLEYLYLNDNRISDISSLKDLNNLTHLTLYGNEVSDISSLAGLKSLESLELSDNNITDITPLKELPKLQTVYLYGMEITDAETIQYLRNEGVEVYYDGDYGDWNDWDDEEWDDEEIIIDMEEVIKSFPEESGFVVSEDGKSISLDLSKQTTAESFELTPQQTQLLIQNKQTLNLQKDDVQATIPASSFDKYGDEPVTIDINEIKSDANSLSSTYDFTIKQGTRTISQFDEGITLTFNVNASRAKNPNNLKVFYLNEETGKWEKVGGTYSNGKVTVVTYHFSTFTVFEAADNNEDSNEIVDIVGEEQKPEEPVPGEPSDETPEPEEEEPMEETPAEPTPGEPSDETTEPEKEEPVENNPEESIPNEPSGETKDPIEEGSEQQVPEKPIIETVTPNEGSAAPSQKDLEADETNEGSTDPKEIENKSGKDNKSVSANEDSQKPTELPNTATNIYNLLFLGFVLILFGLILYRIRKRKIQS
ncbi:internalin [Bacillus freudenreichii]|nr:internalin [Bacillus freudenreichii]